MSIKVVFTFVMIDFTIFPDKSFIKMVLDNVPNPLIVNKFFVGLGNKVMALTLFSSTPTKALSIILMLSKYKLLLFPVEFSNTKLTPVIPRMGVKSTTTFSHCDEVGMK